MDHHYTETTDSHQQDILAEYPKQHSALGHFQREAY